MRYAVIGFCLAVAGLTGRSAQSAGAREHRYQSPRTAAVGGRPRIAGLLRS
jgi:hypothetical protein